ncbi:unnamed protein product, partial [Discosporangium mesarthrocarpum]
MTKPSKPGLGNVTPVVPSKPTAPPNPTSQLDINISVTDLYTIGIGPSSSHTVGPMRAAKRFVDRLASEDILDSTDRLLVELYGSLALTGAGHATDIAILLGLSGERPSSVDPENVQPLIDKIRTSGEISLNGHRVIPFFEDQSLLFLKDQLLPEHSNGMRFYAYDAKGAQLFCRDYFSVGGGYVVSHNEGDRAETKGHNIVLPYPFTSADELLGMGKESGLSIAEIMLANEGSWRSEEETFAFLDDVNDAMINCIKRGCEGEGILPGGLKVKRRANALYQDLMENPERASRDPLTVLDWVNLYALAVNEENA